MWWRAYFFLILVRLYFALSPSYLHPDENFQGPEVIAGRVYSYPVHLTWEFTSEHPIRSAFPLWIVYGLPMGLLRWLWEGIGWGEVPPAVVYWVLRGMMFMLSFVVEDWAIQELAQSPRERRVAVLLVASSYVTWTLQTHTFSNSIEALVVLWSLVLVERILADKRTSGTWASAILGFLSVAGTFTRITFPAFILIPGLRLLPHFWRKPYSLLSFSMSAALTFFMAIAVDTAFYSSKPMDFSDLINRPTITPWNNLVYNSSAINLAKHGVHPYYQHLVANLPQLLGPALPLLIFSFRKTLRLASALTGIAMLSVFPHQEARFLLPAVPLFLSSLRLPKRFGRAWIVTWIIFNTFLGIVMGVYHQGGVVPMQIYLSKLDHGTHSFWWKTYSPPIWLLNGKNEKMETRDLMGMPGEKIVEQLVQVAPCDSTKVRSGNETVYLVAPRSATFLDRFKGLDSNETLRLEELWTYKKHVNLDDLDFEEDGIWPTLQRVIGRRGLTVWKAKKVCGGNGRS